MGFDIRKYIKILVEDEIKNIFLEASYSEKNVPKYFWLVTSISVENDFAKQLVSGVLHGLTGISDTKLIIPQFFSWPRNSILIIPAKDFISLNKVSRIMYDNPHYLVSNNFSALRRLKDLDEYDDYKYSLMQEIVYMTSKAYEKQGDKSNKDIAKIFYYIEYGTLASSWYGSKFSKSNIEINTIKELASWIKQATIDILKEKGDNFSELINIAENFPIEVWYKYIMLGLKRLGKMFKSEGEWLIKSDKAFIPKSSKLLIGLNYEISNKALIEYEKSDEINKYDPLRYQKEELRLIKYVKSIGLEKMYSTRYISGKKIEKLKYRFQMNNI